MQINVEDLIPEAGEFTLKRTGKSYRVRPVNLQDEIWMIKTFGGESAVEEIFTKVKFWEIGRIVYHQLEDKSGFKPVDVTIENENGESFQSKMGGVELLLSLVEGAKEKEAIYSALCVARFGRKFLEETQKKTQSKDPSPSLPTGAPLSTDSAPNTDGQPITS